MSLPMSCINIYFKTIYPSKATTSFNQGLFLHEHTNTQQSWTKICGFRRELLKVNRKGMAIPGLGKYIRHVMMWLF